MPATITGHNSLAHKSRANIELGSCYGLISTKKPVISINSLLFTFVVSVGSPLFTLVVIVYGLLFTLIVSVGNLLFTLVVIVYGLLFTLIVSVGSRVCRRIRGGGIRSAAVGSPFAFGSLGNCGDLTELAVSGIDLKRDTSLVCHSEERGISVSVSGQKQKRFSE